MVEYVEIGTDFVNDGSIVVSNETFGNYFARRGSTQDVLASVDIGLVQLQDGANLSDVQREIQAIAPTHWDVLTKQAIISRDIRFGVSRHQLESSLPLER